MSMLWPCVLPLTTGVNHPPSSYRKMGLAQSGRARALCKGVGRSFLPGAAPFIGERGFERFPLCFFAHPRPRREARLGNPLAVFGDAEGLGVAAEFENRHPVG